MVELQPNHKNTDSGIIEHGQHDFSTFHTKGCSRGEYICEGRGRKKPSRCTQGTLDGTARFDGGHNTEENMSFQQGIQVRFLHKKHANCSSRNKLKQLRRVSMKGCLYPQLPLGCSMSTKRVGRRLRISATHKASRFGFQGQEIIFSRWALDATKGHAQAQYYKKIQKACLYGFQKTKVCQIRWASLTLNTD